MTEACHACSHQPPSSTSIPSYTCRSALGESKKNGIFYFHISETKPHIAINVPLISKCPTGYSVCINI